VRGSLAASALSAAETSFQRVRGAYARVATFVYPSEFMRSTMTEGGWTNPSALLRNPVSVTDEPREEPGTYFLYAGRLSPEKGVEVAAEAARMAGVELLVAGTGPSEQALRSRYPEIRFLGFVDAERIASLLDGARGAVVPSLWFENAPLSVLEPMARGVPVVASRIGGIPEMIDSGVDGILVEPGDVAALADAMARLGAEPNWALSLGSAARLRVARDNSPEAHVTALLGVYETVIQSGRRT